VSGSVGDQQPKPEETGLWWGWVWLLFIGFFLISLGFQVRSGAWRSDFGGHADEAAHVVTSLMMRDYFAGGFRDTLHPVRYAEAYYDRFPKVAIGHYPPGFYVVAGAGLLVFRSEATLLILMNGLSAGVGVLIWWFGRRVVGHAGAAVVVAALYVMMPQTRTYTAVVMADLLVVLCGLLAARSLVLFLRSGRARDSLLFGVWAAAAILTKGSGIGLALLPPISLMLSGNVRLWKRGALWLAPLPVILFALPWMLLTTSISAEGMQEGGGLAWMRTAVPYYAEALVREAGYVALALLGVAAGVGGFRWLWRRQPLEPEESVLWGLLGCGLAVPVLIPAGLDNRYLMPVLPAILLLSATGARQIPAGPGGRWLVVVLAGVALAVLADTWRPVRKFYTGATAALERVMEDRKTRPDAPHRARVLVVSDPRGEGAVIAAAALQDPEAWILSRGSKLLATSDWMGRGYRMTFRSTEEWQALLSAKGVEYVVIDPPEQATAGDHWKQTYELLETGQPARSHHLGDVRSQRREQESRFSVYRFGD